MKKIVPTIAIIVCLLLSSRVFSQTQNQCYSLEKNVEGGIENILVKLSFEGNKVNADYKKEAKIKVDASLIPITKQGIIEGDKIIFSSKEGIKVNGAQTNQNESWTFKYNTLTVEGTVLKLINCK